jgi:RND family efflux transporter MFP subunit
MKLFSSLISPRFRRVVLIVVIPLLVVLMMAWLFGAFHAKVATPPVKIAPTASTVNAPLVAVRRVTVPQTEACSGKVMPVHEADVASQIMEKVVEVKVKAGQEVKKGEVLVRLDDTVLKSRLQQTEATLAAVTSARDEAKTNLGRERQLLESKVSSQAEFDHAETLYKASEANRQGAEKAVKEAQTTLDFATILSPMDGTVIDKQVEVGDMAKPGQILVTIYDRMQVVANVRESLIGRLKEGQPIGVKIDRLGLSCQATVSEIVSEGDPVARTFPVKVVGACHPEVRKGMYAKVLVPLDPEKLLVIPESAVVHVGQLDMVEVNLGGRLERRTVQLGRPLTLDKREMVQVMAGLQEGDQVVEHPAASSERKAEHD